MCKAALLFLERLTAESNLRSNDATDSKTFILGRNMMSDACNKQQQQFDKIIHVKIFCFVCFLSLQFDGEPGEVAKDACAEFCNHQKFALEQLKVSNHRSLFPAAQSVFNSGKAVVMFCCTLFLHIYFLIARITEEQYQLF